MLIDLSEIYPLMSVLPRTHHSPHCSLLDAWKHILMVLHLRTSPCQSSNISLSFSFQAVCLTIASPSSIAICCIITTWRRIHACEFCPRRPLMFFLLPIALISQHLFLTCTHLSSLTETLADPPLPHLCRHLCLLSSS